MPTPLMSRREGVLGKLGMSLTVLAIAPAPLSSACPGGGGLAADGRRRGRREGPAVRGEHLEREEGRVAQSLAVLGGGEPGPRVSGMGSGVLIDGRGYILTNHHVVDKVQGIVVQLFDGTTYPARVLQFDPVMDLAILKVDPDHTLAAIKIGTSSDLMVGETVITIGNAFGYENTVSVGIVSALHRDVTLSDDQVYRNLIQTDACINPGNSGGPLINIDGELIGINVAVRAGAQGIGFALPIDEVKRVAADMLSTRRLASTWHGLVASEQRNGPGTRGVDLGGPAGEPGGSRRASSPATSWSASATWPSPATSTSSAACSTSAPAIRRSDDPPRQHRDRHAPRRQGGCRDDGQPRPRPIPMTWSGGCWGSRPSPSPPSTSRRSRPSSAAGCTSRPSHRAAPPPRRPSRKATSWWA